MGSSLGHMPHCFSVLKLQQIDKESRPGRDGLPQCNFDGGAVIRTTGLTLLTSSRLLLSVSYMNFPRVLLLHRMILLVEAFSLYLPYCVYSPLFFFY